MFHDAPVSIEGLKEPVGWFLYRARHRHADGPHFDEPRPLPDTIGPYSVEFQRYLSGGLIVEGKGRTLVEAWAAAAEAAAHREISFRAATRPIR